MDEYEFKVGMKFENENNSYDKPIIPLFHNDDEYDSMEEYENIIKHFQD
jgi:hypothetical protein